MRPGGDIQRARRPGSRLASRLAAAPRLALALLLLAAMPALTSRAGAPAETFPLAPEAPPGADDAASLPPPLPASLPLPPRSDAATDVLRGEFTIAAGMLDTWNAVGQILVRLEGVAYEGRAQMLGIYVVRYRGERVLVVTRALVLSGTERRSLTRVSTVGPDGRRDDGAVAAALLGQLQQRLPEELARIAAGERGAVSTTAIR